MEPTESVGDQLPKVAIDATTHQAQPFSASLDRSLFLIVCVMLLFTVSLLTVNLAFQYRNYHAGISGALGSDFIDHAVVITYTRAWDFAVVKVSSIFLAFCLIMIGALYVLRAATVSYSFTLTNRAHKGSLETGSPGLVMITLGVVLMAVVVLSTSKVEYQKTVDSPILSDAPAIPADNATPSTSQTPKPGKERDKR